MKKFTIICTLFGLLVLLALAVTSCPKTGDIEPGQGDVVTKPVGPPVSERETEVPSDAAATPEQLEEIKTAQEAKEAAEGAEEEGVEEGVEEGGEEAGGDEEAAPEDSDDEGAEGDEDAGDDGDEAEEESPE